MDFTEYLYKNIGERVRLDRQTKKMNLSTYSRHISDCTFDKKVKETGDTQKTLSRQSLLTHDRKRILAYNEAEQYKSVVFNRAFPSLYKKLDEQES